ncbi:PIG-L deacetylase family protein [Lacisediminimonas profundi]|uniref:PIG-L deacetylase family protein n=1 Tax=Lacisediminimonas profundi TaxID=2603856 RepID=UPI001F4FA590|nr:PIG-L family deacetylase [Lacisediminimonas profundi]
MTPVPLDLTAAATGRGCAIPGLDLTVPATIVVLAPHPDDFDAIGVTMRWLQSLGHQIHVAVLTSGANGVKDGWQGATQPSEKAAIREAEQRSSCAFFGLPPERLSFLRLWEEVDGRPYDEALQYQQLRNYLAPRQANMVFLPHGNDSNRTHRRTWETFHSIATQDDLKVHAFLNLDAKTLSFRADVVMSFEEEAASWKRELLRFHRSQQERNLKTRGIGFDERVLAVNRAAADHAASPKPYAEVFELQRFG